VTTVGDIALFIAGVVLVVIVLDAVLRTFVVPRGTVVAFTALVFLGVRQLFRPFAPQGASYARRDRVTAVYGPFALISIPAVALFFIFIAFSLIFRSLADRSWHDAFATSGSSLMTLGFERPGDLPSLFLTFLEAAIGLGLLALLIAYLPTIYNSFSRREVAVTDLSIRAGSPPTPREFIVRAHRTGFLTQIDDFFESWMTWFTEVQETHTSYGALVFFRSPNPNRNWVTAAGVVLDTAALRLAAVNMPFSPVPPLCIRSGYLALREVAGFYGYDFDSDPSADDPISIAREEFDGVFDDLRASGVPMVPDREQAWRDFAGWRVNYDQVLHALAALVDAPYTPWISDRSPRRPARRYRLGRRRIEMARGRVDPR
jgi:hypothetical protein